MWWEEGEEGLCVRCGCVGLGRRWLRLEGVEGEGRNREVGAINDVEEGVVGRGDRSEHVCGKLKGEVSARIKPSALMGVQLVM